MKITIRPARRDDAAAIAAIYNIGIGERSATFETAPRTEAQVAERLEQAERYPMLVAVADTGTVVGWAGVSEYRPRQCYAGIGEFSIYLAPEARGRGIGKTLLFALIDVARERGYWKLLSRVFLFNSASRGLCRACGFREVGIYEQHAMLDGTWLDVVIVERLLGP
jgi:L-amino acid N-acyltransferase YncA